jgi:ABC-type sugar transport system ATPase subunit
MDMIELKHIKKDYDNKQGVIKDFNLTISKKEFVVFLGPSGCGKSTTLRMIAGLEAISSGDLFIEGVRQNDLPAKDRDIAVVFQNYALYPHMTVFQNIGFGLKVRNVPKKTIKEKVEAAAELLNLTDYLKSYPRDLSGGQMQRVALGRALVRETNLFLMDEPLSNLDAKLRTTMREEIVQFHRRLNATTIYVTHDQTEAMTMGDKIVIMNQGEIQQIGSPSTIYKEPANLFVANFIGSPSMNILPLRRSEGSYFLEDYMVELPKGIAQNHDIVLGIRSEDVEVVKDKGIRLKIDYIEDVGSDQFLHGQLNGVKMIVRQAPEISYEVSQEISLAFKKGKISWFDTVTGNRLVVEQ